MFKNAAGLLVLAVILCLPLICRAQNVSPTDPMAWVGDRVQPPDTSGPDKSGYNLFNPVPDGQMRAFGTDRPGKTHNSTTLDAGHFQIESDFFNYTYDHSSPSGQTFRSLNVATPILKAGLTNSVDLEAAFDLYNNTHATGLSKGQGFGDFALGSKINLFGNDGGDRSLALLPFVIFPTAARNSGGGAAQYTLNVPYTLELDTLWSLTVEPALGFLKNPDNTGHHGDYSLLANINRPLFFKDVTAALEVAGEYSDRFVTPRYTLDPSLQWLVTSSFQLDVGAYIGLNKAAPDYTPYMGVSFRY